MQPALALEDPKGDGCFGHRLSAAPRRGDNESGCQASGPQLHAARVVDEERRASVARHIVLTGDSQLAIASSPTRVVASQIPPRHARRRSHIGLRLQRGMSVSVADRSATYLCSKFEGHLRRLWTRQASNMVGQAGNVCAGMVGPGRLSRPENTALRPSGPVSEGPSQRDAAQKTHSPEPAGPAAKPPSPPRPISSSLSCAHHGRTHCTGSMTALRGQLNPRFNDGISDIADLGGISFRKCSQTLRNSSGDRLEDVRLL